MPKGFQDKTDKNDLTLTKFNLHWDLCWSPWQRQANNMDMVNKMDRQK